MESSKVSKILIHLQMMILIIGYTTLSFHLGSSKLHKNIHLFNITLIVLFLQAVCWFLYEFVLRFFSLRVVTRWTWGSMEGLCNHCILYTNDIFISVFRVSRNDMLTSIHVSRSYQPFWYGYKLTIFFMLYCSQYATWLLKWFGSIHIWRISTSFSFQQLNLKSLLQHWCYWRICSDPVRNICSAVGSFKIYVRTTQCFWFEEWMAEV